MSYKHKKHIELSLGILEGEAVEMLYDNVWKVTEILEVTELEAD